ncbi:MAG: acyltransferase [Gammaproteobacteria bacterium]|nr:acyltransferase [Gammaproteobacteria bacterium]
MKDRFSALDSFRGLAALCVVMYHMHFVDTLTESSFFRGSFIFVDFFFVLSGFVLAHGYGFRTKIKFKDFLQRRALRLFPLHILMLIGFIMFEATRLAATYLFEVSFNSIPFSGSQDISEILPNLLLLQAWLPSADPFSFNAPSWSISVEFYLYLVLFITILTGNRSKQILWLLLASAGVYLTLNTDVWKAYFGFSNEVLRGLVGFFGGVVMYLCYRLISRFKLVNSSGRSWLTKTLFTAYELILVIATVRLVSFNDSTNNLSLISLFCIVVLSFSFQRGWISTLLNIKIFQYLGKISYSIYLTHSLVLLCVNALIIAVQNWAPGAGFTFVEAGGRHFDSGLTWLNYGLLIAILLLVIVVSHNTYYRVERRFYK